MEKQQVVVCPDPSLLGVQIVYCDEHGKKKKVWVDLTQVNGISWCGQPQASSESAPPTQKKSARSARRKKMPTDPNGGKKPCPKRKLHRNGGTPMCWWDGARWQCGEAEE